MTSGAHEYSDEQVEAAFVAWTKSRVDHGQYESMRRALAAASVPAQRLVLPPAEPQPDAPTDIAALPDYWDERRRRQGKPDLSRCAAELRRALALSPSWSLRNA